MEDFVGHVKKIRFPCKNDSVRSGDDILVDKKEDTDFQKTNKQRAIRLKPGVRAWLTTELFVF